VETNPFFENAPVGDFSFGAWFAHGEGLEEAGLEFVGVGFEGVVLEQAFLKRLKDAATDVVIGDLGVEGPWVFGGGSVANEPG
jgi:hypothetical protein